MASSNQDSSGSSSKDDPAGLIRAKGKTKPLIPRSTFMPSDDPTIRQHLAILTAYLEDTQLEETFQKLCHLLLSRSDLPYNPYPGFSRRIRMTAERYHMYEKSDDEISALLDLPITEPDVAFIVRPRDDDFLWGLKNIIQVTDPRNLIKYAWLLEDLVADKSTLVQDDQYSNQVMIALVGTAVFQGTFYVEPNMLKVRIEYLITGPDVTKGVQMFVNSVLNDLTRMDEDATHILLGLTVPVISADNPGVFNLQFWPMEKITNNQSDLWGILSDTVTTNHYIIAECVFKVDQYTDTYLRGQKEYALNFVELSNSEANEKLSSFSEFPMSTLYEGVFFNRIHAEAYLSTFTPRLDIIDKDREPEPDPLLARTTQEDPALEDTEWGKPQSRSKTSRMVIESSRNVLSRPGSGDQTSRRGLADRYKEMLPKEAAAKIKTDGFQTHDRDGNYAPDAWQIVSPIKGAWQKKIAHLHPQDNLFDIVYYTLLLLLLDRTEYNPSLTQELYRVLHSTASRLHYYMEQNNLIRDLVFKFEGNVESPLVHQLFLQYRDGLTSLLDSELQERSSDFVTASKVIRLRLDSIMSTEKGFTETVPLKSKTLKDLEAVNYYCSSMLLQLIEDMLIWTPELDNIIERIKEAFKDDVPQPQTPIMQQQMEPPQGTDRATEYKVQQFKYGKEDETIMKHDMQALNVEMCMERDPAPKVMVMESVLMKYLIDTHMDEVWTSFLVDILAGAHLPPNPYPRLVTMLRQAAMKMDLCFETDEKLCSRLLNRSARIEDPDNYIYHIPGCDAHGYQSALTLLDSSTFSELVPILQQFVNNDFTRRKGPYKLALCLAISGHTTWYGRMDPYLYRIVLHEHCHVKGPQGCAGEALQVYTRVVYDHVVELNKNKELIITGMYMGEEKNRWNIDDIILRRKGFASEFERFVNLKEPVFLKIYVKIGWRYVPVTKMLLFHFVTEDEITREIFFPGDFAASYRNVFLEREKAAFHFQQGGPIDRADPFSGVNCRIALSQIDRHVLHAANKLDWINVHRWLLTRTLINQGQTHVAETWRMLHSVATQIEFANELNRSLKDLIMYVHEKTRKQEQDEADDPQSQQARSNKQGNLDLADLGEMMLAYREKVNQISKSSTAMSPRCLIPLLQVKLQSVMERDAQTKTPYVKIEPNTLFVLEEVWQIMRQTQDAVANDIHSVSPEAQAAVKSIQAEAMLRPQSVASVQLDDPDSYFHQPMAKPDHLNQWIEK